MHPFAHGAAVSVPPFVPFSQTFNSPFGSPSPQYVQKPYGAQTLVIECTAPGGTSAMTAFGGGYSGAGGGYAKRTLTGSNIPNNLRIDAGYGVSTTSGFASTSSPAAVFNNDTNLTLCSAGAGNSANSGQSSPPLGGALIVGDTGATGGNGIQNGNGGAGAGPYGGPGGNSADRNGFNFGGGGYPNNGNGVSGGYGNVRLTWG